MDYSDKLLAHRLIEDSLLKYGFQKEDGTFVLSESTTTDPSFSFNVKLNQDSFKVDLIDSVANEIYSPFSVEGAHGSFVASFREEAESLVEDILSRCFESDSLREKLIVYVKEHYDAEITYPWPQQFPRYCTIREKNNPKWFGLIMNVPYTKLGIKKKGEAEILNVKLGPEEIQKLIDHKTYLPAYHMSKKDWISIVLSLETPFEDVKRLLEESHTLCLQKKK
jgi:predicted DNA-binding protein (MmcQ/YjbR family)